MSKDPRRFARPVRLIVSVAADLVEAIDRLLTQRQHHGFRNRAEFVRLAIERELARRQSDDFLSPCKRGAHLKNNQSLTCTSRRALSTQP